MRIFENIAPSSAYPKAGPYGSKKEAQMKKTWIVAVALLFVALAGSAEEARRPEVAPEVRDVLLARLAADVECGTAATAAAGPIGVPEVMFAANKSACTATANCQTGTVSCNGNTSCVAYDRDCPYERGRVICDSVTTLCPTDCCNEGTLQQRACCRCAATGDCWQCAFCEYGYFPQGACP